MTLLLLALLGCGRTPPAPDSQPEVRVPPSVLLVTLDTVRADRLGAWGYARARTDALDALAARGRRYARAYAPVPLTIPSHATLLTGLMPSRHGIRANGDRALALEHTTLAERLQAAGYATGASVAAFVTTRPWQLDQGYQGWSEPPVEDVGDYWHAARRGDAVVDDALAWLATVEEGQPWHLWVHLYDAHHPYDPPDAYVDPEDPRPYDGELAFLDDQVARLLAAIDPASTLVVIVGDHGEALGEHGEATHGLYVYEGTQHVPLILAGPGMEPAVVDAPVSLADVVPLVLDGVGLPPAEGLDGVLARTTPVVLESWQLAQRFGVAPHVAVVDGPLKLIDLPRPELYDVRADPGERRDLAADRPEDVRRLRELLAHQEPTAPAASAPPAGGEVLRGLQALGYVVPDPAPADRRSLPDPKDHAVVVTLEQRAEQLTRAGDTTGAEAALREALAGHPDVVELWTRLAGLLGQAGREEEALQAVQEGLARDPTDPHLTLLRANHLARTGAFAEAAVGFREAALSMPYAPRLRGLAVGSLRFAGQPGEAGRLGEQWLSSYPDDAYLAGALGVVRVEQGRTDEAARLVERGCAAEPPPLEACYWAAASSFAQDRPQAALRQLAREVEAHPGHLRAAITLATFGLEQQHWELALQGALAASARVPADADVAYLEVQSLFNLERFAEAREALARGLVLDPRHPDLLLMDANLLAKEGRRDEGEARFREAQEALAARTGLSREEVGLPPLAEGEAPATRPGWTDVE